MMLDIRNILDNPILYSAWQGPFAAQKIIRGIPHDAREKCQSVLDIGCGPGVSRSFFPNKEYVGVDINPKYIKSARKRFEDRFICASCLDLTMLDSESFDFILINSLLHHLSDDDCSETIKQAKRLLKKNGEMYILELLIPPHSCHLATFICKKDRGDYPRAASAWESLVAQQIEVVVSHTFWLTLYRMQLWQMISIKARNE